MQVLQKYNILYDPYSGTDECQFLLHLLYVFSYILRLLNEL